MVIRCMIGRRMTGPMTGARLLPLALLAMLGGCAAGPTLTADRGGGAMMASAGITGSAESLAAEPLAEERAEDGPVAALAPAPAHDIHPRIARAGIAVAAPEPPDAIEIGEASWYGAAFAGRPTASGEPFDPEALTAAHPALPFGTAVTVVNLDNGRSVDVVINDRGPFIDDRVIDLSRAAARLLGFLRDGITRVNIYITAPPDSV